GACVGGVERDRQMSRDRVAAGDLVRGLASSGLHSTGLSLARKALFEQLELGLVAVLPGLDAPLGQAMLTPTRIYVKPVLRALAAHFDAIHGMAHITGGG